MEDSVLQPQPSQTVHSRHGLADMVMQAFEQACDQHDVEVANHLLDALDLLAARLPARTKGAGADRKVVTNVAAHERMWRLRNSNPAKKMPR